MSRKRTKAVAFAWTLAAGLFLNAAGAAAQARLITDTPLQAQADTTATVTHNTAAGETAFPDSIRPGHNDKYASADSARLTALNDSLTDAFAKDSAKKVKERFVPDPKRALWLSLILPGAGQIYNRKYWKLPFIYGGFLGCTYALMWNQQMYKDYSQAYLDIMDDDPSTDSYLDMLPLNYDITGREEQFQSRFKQKKDYYRRYRDLSVFCFIGVYLISVIDAYVDAQLSVFDISPDLTMTLEPAVIPTKSGTTQTTASYGIGCSLHF